MAATFESVLVLRLRDVQELSKTYFNKMHGNREKFVARIKIVIKKMFFCVLMD